MKIISLLLSLCIASVALAEEPAELERLRHLWEQSVAKEVDEKNKIYLKSLEKLQKKFTVANNLAAAVAVNDEMQKVKAIKPLEKASPFDGMWLQKYKGFTHLKVIMVVLMCMNSNNLTVMNLVHSLDLHDPAESKRCVRIRPDSGVRDCWFRDGRWRVRFHHVRNVSFNTYWHHRHRRASGGNHAGRHMRPLLLGPRSFETDRGMAKFFACDNLRSWRDRG